MVITGKIGRFKLKYVPIKCHDKDYSKTMHVHENVLLNNQSKIAILSK